MKSHIGAPCGQNGQLFSNSIDETNTNKTDSVHIM